jgi:hypothetical protein
VADTDSAGLQVSPGSSIFNNFLCRYSNLSKDLAYSNVAGGLD